MLTIKTVRIGALALALGLFAACGGGEAKGPAGVAEAFLTAINEGDFDKAAKYATEGSQESLKSMAGMAKMEKEMAEKTGTDAEKPEKVEIKIGEVTEDGDNATVAYTENGSEQTLEMVKEGGKWKAVFEKPGGDMNFDDLDLGDELEGLDSLDLSTDAAEPMTDGKATQ